MILVEAMQQYLDDFLIELGRDEWVNIDWLTSEAVSFSISPVPLENSGIVGQDVVGNLTKRFAVMFSVVFEYSADLAKNIENSAFFEELDKYIKNNNKNDILPQLTDDRAPLQVRITQTPYFYMVPENNQSAQYVTTVELTYKERV